MLLYNNSFDSLIILFSYMFIYNLSLINIFWTMQQFVNSNFKTIYSFSEFKFNFFLITTITITLFSMAGVPPFLGFFTKLLILLILLNSNFFLLYIFFFALLFFGLYFYLQNIRFLHNTNTGKTFYNNSLNLTQSSLFFIVTFTILFFLIFGFIFLDDIILYFNWLFN